jgi:hypothetical protein
MGQLFNAKAAIQDDDPFQVVIDVGTVTFSTTDSQATYRTKLLDIVGGSVNLTGTTSAATDAASNDEVSIPLGAVTSGSITLTRSSKGTSAGKYAVILYGRRFTASP